jgi:putative NADH-flavin reductase
MKVALIGATGFVGAALLKEALARGHTVTAVVRDVAKLPQNEKLIARQADVNDEAKLAEILRGQDAVISAFSPGWDKPDMYDLQVRGATAILNAVKEAGVRRFLLVGGAGSLEVAPGVQLLDTPDFPEKIKPGALATREVFYLVRQEQDLEWTVLCPPARLEPGERTGKFRLGLDQLLVDDQGQSKISSADYAMAMIDELENPKHIRRRFTVGY